MTNINKKSKQIFGKNSIRAISSTLILTVPLLLSVLTELHIIYKFSLIIIIACTNLFFVYFNYRKPKTKIEKILNVMILSLWMKKREHFRANVMIDNPKKKILTINYSSANMMGAVDRNFCIKYNQGCTGEAFTKKKVTVVDLKQKSHKDYQINPSNVWSEMKSILSVPIFEDGNPSKVIGVLNIDSDLDVASTRFLDTNVINVVNTYSDWTSELM